jgi:EmrB/QacA subfamily drug resistance transporter
MERRWQVLAVVSVAVFVVGLDLFIVNIAFPDIRADFDDASVASLSWVLNAYAIVFAALLVPAGRLADRFGRRRGFLAGLALFVGASALCGLAPSVPALVAARVVQAAGAALLMPTGLALLLGEFPAAQRPAAIGVWAGVGGVAAAAGPPIGGLLVEVSWRLIFLVNLPVGLVAAAYAVRLLQESRDETSTRLPDLAGTALLTLSVGALALGLVKAPDWGWGDARTLACLAGAALGLAWFLARCARHPSPVVDLAMLRVRSYAFANATVLLFNAAFAAMLLSGVLFMTGVWGYSVLHAGLAFTPGPLMAAIAAVSSGRVANRVGQRRLAAAGSLLFALGCSWWLWRLGTTPDYAADLLPGQILNGTGVGLVLSSTASAAAASLPPARFATGSATLSMSRQLGAVLGVSIFVAVLGTPTPAEALDAFDNGYHFMIAAALLAALAAVAIGDVRPAALRAPRAAAAAEAPSV